MAKQQNTRLTCAKRKEIFLGFFKENANMTWAAEKTGVDRHRVYMWKKEDPEFKKAFEDAKEVACDRLEEEAHRRAVTGVSKPVFHNGKKVGELTEYSDTLLIFLMKGAMPQKYRERWEGKLEANVDLSVSLAERLAKALEDE